MEIIMQLRSFKIHVQVGEYQKGIWRSDTSGSFDVIIQCQYSQQAEKIAQAQFGGKERCKVSFRGEVK
jgi:hypothetical protein